MKYFFLGLLWDPERSDEKSADVRDRRVQPAERFQWSLIRGLEEALGRPVSVVNCLPVGSFPSGSSLPFLPFRKWSHGGGADNTEVGGINVPIFKQAWRTFALRRILKEIIGSSSEPCILFAYSLYQPFLSAIAGLDGRCRKYFIVPDLPEFYDLTHTGLVRTISRRLNNWLIQGKLGEIDGYVLLTAPMACKLGIGDVPQVVVEGVLDPSIHPAVYEGPRMNAILYSGTLNFAFGIREFVEAFMLVGDSACRLLVCGTGEGTSFVQECALRDPRIEFLGMLDWNDLAPLQRKVRFLVNPRRNAGEYTKYSFPSKTLEYLASGTPVMAYRLDGIPEEYGPYVYWLDEASAPITATQISELLSKDDFELIMFGKAARNFVLSEKVQRTQAVRIVNTLLEN